MTTHSFGSTLLKSLGHNKYTSAAPDIANKMRRTAMINPSIPPTVSATELEALFRILYASSYIVGGSLGWLVGGRIVAAVSVQTPPAVYNPYTADTQQLYVVEGRRLNSSTLNVVLFPDIPIRCWSLKHSIWNEFGWFHIIILFFFFLATPKWLRQCINWYHVHWWVWYWCHWCLRSLCY